MWTTARHLFSFARPYKWPILLAASLTGSLTIIGMAPPLLMRRLIDDVATREQWGLFPLLLTLLLSVPVLRASINIATSISLNTISLGIIRDTRRSLFRHILHLSTDYHRDTGPGALQQRLMGDVGVVSNLMSGGLITLMSDLIAVTFAVVVMLRLNTSLSALVFALLPLYFLNYWFFSRRIHSTTAALRANMDHISSSLQERLNAHQLIQAYGQEKAEAGYFSSQSKQVMDTAVKGASYSIAFNQLSAFVNKTGNTLIYCAGCYYFVLGTMGYGDVIAFCAYATQVLGPIVRFVNVANQIKQAGVSIERIQEVMHCKPSIRQLPASRPVRKLNGDIRVQEMSLSFPRVPDVLVDINLTVEAGTHLAVLGSKGTGKTALAMLLRRFCEPTAGHIAVDGVDIRQYRLDDYRKATGLVQSQSAVFDGTIEDNLRYGNPEAGERQMLEAATGVGLHDFVARLHHGYQTRIGSGGMRLATGIQQKLGIARALLYHPSILILDDAVAALDPDSAHKVIDTVLEFMKDKTCILTLSRALLAMDADQIAMLGGNGDIAEVGTPDILLAQPHSAFRALFVSQYGIERVNDILQEDKQ